VDIEGNLKAYISAREPTARYTSFDYCFNYFRDYSDRGSLNAITTEDIQGLKHALTKRAPKTVNNVLTVLNVALRKAVE
jgi:hypothetical protein